MRQLSPFLVCSHSLITPLIGTFQILRIKNMHFSEVKIPVRNKLLEGSLSKCPEPGRIVLFSHGSGSSRKSPRNRLVAESLWQKGISTLLFDLLTEQESADFSLRFDIPLLTERLIGATLWVRTQPEIQDYRMGYFGASTGAAAALGAAAGRQDIVAVVSRGGRPDLVMNVLPSVHIPVLFIVGGRDEVIGALNKEAFDLLKGEKQLLTVPGATHLFEEIGTLEQVAKAAAAWFDRYFKKAEYKNETQHAPTIQRPPGSGPLTGI